MTTAQIFTITISEVKYDDDTRQRKALDPIKIAELAESIRRLGLLNPIIVDEGHRLIAGRRRLEAARRLGQTTILARRFDSLSPADQRLVELDENLRRVDLPWQETALAILELHELKENTEGHWDQNATAEYAGLAPSQVSRSLLVARALRVGDSKVASAAGINSAAELLTRRRKLVLDTAMSRGFDEIDEPTDGEATPGVPDLIKSPVFPDTPFDETSSPVRVSVPALKHRIQNADFLEWVKIQESPKWNLIHCDFPYGLNLEKSGQASSASHETQYEDSPEIFWRLTDGLLRHQDKFILSSAHMIFWFSMKYYTELVKKLETAGWWTIPHPLIWHKTDGAGIASDFRRRPKHIYETALFCARGDRPLVLLRNDVFGGPIAKAQEGHLSAKPLPMLEHFLSMVCDSNSYLLDPTCGSGTAIRAARRLGSAMALGLELNSETAAAAQLKLDMDSQ